MSPKARSSGQKALPLLADADASRRVLCVAGGGSAHANEAVEGDHSFRFGFQVVGEHDPVGASDGEGPRRLAVNGAELTRRV